MKLWIAEGCSKGLCVGGSVFYAQKFKVKRKALETCLKKKINTYMCIIQF